MAGDPLQFEIDTRGQQALIGALREMRDGLQSVQGAVAQQGGAWGDWSSRITAATQAFNVLRDVGGTVVGALRDMALEMDRNSDIVSHFSGDIEEARRRTSGMASSIDLMLASNRAAQAGLQLTGRELANVTVAAGRFAEANGEDLIPTIDRLMGAMISGQSRALRPFGLAIEATGDQARDTAATLELLERRVGSLSLEANSAGDALNQMDVSVGELRREFLDAISDTKAFENSLNSLGEAFGGTGDSVTEFVRSLGTGLGIAIQTTASNIGHLARAASELIGGNYAAAAMSAGLVSVDLADRILASVEAYEATAAAMPPRLPGVGVRPAPAPAPLPFGQLPPEGDFLGGGRPRRGARRSGPSSGAIEAQRAFEAMAAEGRAGGFQGFGVGEAVDINTIREELLEEAKAQAGVRDHAIEQSKTAAEALVQEAKAMMELEEATRATSAAYSSLGDIQSAAAGLITEGITAAISGQRAEFDAIIRDLGASQIGKGAANILEGLVMTVFGNPQGPALVGFGGAQIALGSALFGGGVAAAPAAGGVSASGGGGGGSARPESSRGGGGGGGEQPPIIINYNSPVPSEQIGLLNARADRDAKRRFGRAA